MEETLQQLLEPRSTITLLVVIAVSLAALGKFADLVVDYAVILSERSGIPKVVIGATIVSLGTTAPEVAVSVLAAFQGEPGLAMGNAVGSIICDTGLILGLACVIRPLTIPWDIANRQGWVQLASGFLIVLLSIPWSDPLSPFTAGAEGNFPQWAGFLCLFLLALYLWVSVQWTRQTAGAASDGASRSSDASEPAADTVSSAMHDEAAGASAEAPAEHEPAIAPSEHEAAAATPVLLIKLIIAITGVIVSANVLIPAVTIVATRMNIPESILAATLVAFGTSLPELVTAVQAARRGHGDLAVGNIIGADILNALFVAGAAAAVTPAGLTVARSFFWPAFPAMLFVLIVFRIGIYICRTELTRRFGLVLLGAYIAYLGVSIAAGVSPGH